MNPKQYLTRHCFFFFFAVVAFTATQAQQITVAAQPAQLNIRSSTEYSIRITLKPLSFKDDFVFTPALAEKTYPKPFISLTKINKPVKKTAGRF
ncbi:hypothetical protein AB9E30_35340, partial [Rhizobium leguminosarum]